MARSIIRRTSPLPMGQPSELAHLRVVAGYDVYLGMAALHRIGAVDDPLDRSVEPALAEMGVSGG
ncbi:hypothetical protein FHR32_004857 [Streptosporangium album]|uniref:Uncharacterized protein n=1 Tax=Streptosporangium album TaxID=47479 RepID=A0A7W7RYB3_9ACTN|nr:hypothetical protein [Streptosporangium album]MBB4940480.1 hypothetical protein [Streptosporangium album]